VHPADAIAPQGHRLSHAVGRHSQANGPEVVRRQWKRAAPNGDRQ
jgi:hypothetical protein